MAKFRLTTRAVLDLSEIADFTIQSFGIEQARLYRDGFNNCFEALTKNPQLGRNAAELLGTRSLLIYLRQNPDAMNMIRQNHPRIDIKRSLQQIHCTNTLPSRRADTHKSDPPICDSSRVDLYVADSHSMEPPCGGTRKWFRLTRVELLVSVFNYLVRNNM